MTDPDCRATLDVLTELVTPALFTDENLRCLVSRRMVNLSLEHGNSDGSCFAYVWLGWFVGPRFGDYEAGVPLRQARPVIWWRSAGWSASGPRLHVLREPRHALDEARAQQAAIAAARLRRARRRPATSRMRSIACDRLITNLLAAGDPLGEVQREAENGLEFARKARFGLVVDIITGQLGLIRTLRGLTPSSAPSTMRSSTRAGSSSTWRAIRIWHSPRAGTGSASCRRASSRATTCPPSRRHRKRRQTDCFGRRRSTIFELAEYHFYGALARARSAILRSPRRRPQHLEALAAHHKQLEVWAENCPENFENRAALVGAEIARIEGRELDAERLYEQAIRSARANGFVHNEALANELAARFYVARGFEKIAHAYLRDARYGYLRWGADGKVRQLDQLYPHLTKEESVRGPTITIEAPVEHLDLATVIKVSQAVSGEIVLEKLIDTLMRTAIEHAGAERGLLILPRGDELRIEAEATTSGDTVTVCLREASVAATELPESVLHYVVRTQESVILDDASAQNSFSEDSYIRQHHARSILCLPLLKQAKLIGVLYLENNLALHVFTPARIAVLKLLASEAAISLENTRLYSELTEREARIRRLVEANIIGIVIWNLEGRIIEANEAFLRMVGYGREDLVSGRVSWREITPDKWRDADEQALAELAATGVCEPFEKEYIRKDGSRVPVLVGAALLEGGRDEGVAFVLDLTERKRAEEKLRRSEAYLAEAQKLSQTGSWAWSPDEDVRYWSEECYRVLGFDPRDGLPRFEELFQRIHPDDQPKLKELMQRVVREKIEFETDYRLVHPDGAVRDIHSTGHPVFSPSGDLIEFMGTVIDVTERKRAEEELRDQ